MKHKVFLIPVCGLIFFLLGFSNDLSERNFSNNSLAGKYHYEYDHCKIDLKAKNKPECKCGWDYDSEDKEEVLSLNENGTFKLERISPQGGFEILPAYGNWTITAEGNLFLAGSYLPDGEFLSDDSYTETFSIFNGNLVENNDSKKIPWIKQN